MPERSSKSGKKKDINETAFAIMQQVTGEAGEVIGNGNEKNPAAVALGRLGGLKGGKARAEKLSANKRSSIAKKAAAARWTKKNSSKRDSS